MTSLVVNAMKRLKYWPEETATLNYSAVKKYEIIKNH